jgi:hypothetical protein
MHPLWQLGGEEGAWANFVNDDQLSAPTFINYKKPRLFRDFLDVLVPLALSDIWDLTADMSLIIRTHHAVLGEFKVQFAKNLSPDRAKSIDTHMKLAAANFDNPDMYLAVYGAFTPEVYCMQRPGLSIVQFDAFEKGNLTVGQLYVARPSFILRHVLPKAIPLN